ncbi:MAG: hypothetical protein NZV14_02370 [Bryobacteraceae bacterium]|nr:hypothetical protein [Bryobacteraceae bacterium]MDW8376976.1 SpoIID/LytB domain-containing protein [Bryobacterales bacterium]
MRWGVMLLPAVLAGQDLQIGVLGLFHPQHALVHAGSMQIGAELIPQSGPVLLAAENQQIVIRRGTELRRAREVSFQALRKIEIPGKISRRFFGRATVQARANELVLAVLTDLETAVATSVSAEAPHAPREAARAQAVLARSYYRAARRRHSLFDFCDTTHCQLFQDPPNAMAQSAAASTAGIILRHLGQPVEALFFRSCGGTTLNSAQVGLDASSFPYRAVPCEPCARSPLRWRSRLPFAEAHPLLAGTFSENQRLELARRFGWQSLRSNFFELRRLGDWLLVEGKGEGHGVGLCQRGAAWMAQRGALYAEILAHYFPGAQLGQ